MSESLPPVNRHSWPVERSPYARNRVVTFAFLLIVVFTICTSLKLMSDHASPSNRHQRFEKRQVQGNSLLGTVLSQTIQSPDISDSIPRMPATVSGSDGLAVTQSEVSSIAESSSMWPSGASLETSNMPGPVSTPSSVPSDPPLEPLPSPLTPIFTEQSTEGSPVLTKTPQDLTSQIGIVTPMPETLQTSVLPSTGFGSSDSSTEAAFGTPMSSGQSAPGQSITEPSSDTASSVDATPFIDSGAPMSSGLPVPGAPTASLVDAMITGSGAPISLGQSISGALSASSIGVVPVTVSGGPISSGPSVPGATAISSAEAAPITVSGAPMPSDPGPSSAFASSVEALPIPASVASISSGPSVPGASTASSVDGVPITGSGVPMSSGQSISEASSASSIGAVPITASEAPIPSGPSIPGASTASSAEAVPINVSGAPIPSGPSVPNPSPAEPLPPAGDGAAAVNTLLPVEPTGTGSGLPTSLDPGSTGSAAPGSGPGPIAAQGPPLGLANILQGNQADTSVDASNLLSGLSNIVDQIAQINPEAASHLTGAVLDALPADSAVVDAVDAKVQEVAQSQAAHPVPSVLGAIAATVGEQVTSDPVLDASNVDGALKNVVHQGNSVISQIKGALGANIDPALQDVLDQVTGFVDSAEGQLQNPMCIVNSGAPNEVIVPCAAAGPDATATMIRLEPVEHSAVAKTADPGTAATNGDVSSPSHHVPVPLPMDPQLPTGEVKPNPTNSASASASQMQPPVDISESSQLPSKTTGVSLTEPPSPPDGPQGVPLPQSTVATVIPQVPTATDGIPLGPSSEFCPPCPQCSSDSPSGSPTVNSNAGPCEGRGFECDECLNGWFCPPKETPAQQAPCGLGWPCYHCSDGWFCVSEAEKVKDEASAAPTIVTSVKPGNEEGISLLANQPQLAGIPTPADSLKSAANKEDESKGYTYLGCFQDGRIKALLGGTNVDYLSGGMSTAICTNHCFERGYTFAGTENGHECWCGETINPDATRLPESYCQTPCHGNRDHACGGRWAISVFADRKEPLQEMIPYW